MHRDIKPENILLNKNGNVKIADFGFTKSVLNSRSHTDYISTRWYRAPELLLKKNDYSFEIDIFALGCVFAELLLLQPLFPGKNEIDQIYLIFKRLGKYIVILVG
jgi:serine/threonine protein kinase